MVKKALLIKPPRNPLDLREIIDIACAEAKKAFAQREYVTVVDLIIRPYGVWVVVEIPEVRGLAKLR